MTVHVVMTEKDESYGNKNVKIQRLNNKIVIFKQKYVFFKPVCNAEILLKWHLRTIPIYLKKWNLQKIC